MKNPVCDVCGTPYQGRTFDSCPCCGGRERIPDGCTCGQLKNTLGVPLNVIVEKNPCCPVHGDSTGNEDNCPIEIALPTESKFPVELSFVFKGTVRVLQEVNSCEVILEQLLRARPALRRAWEKGRENRVLFQLGRWLRRSGLSIAEFDGPPWTAILRIGYEW